ncbi:hypothetical protein G6F56_005274 [Rhizopus delemar]|nr:hypothetical protein G6F56_005274 [Rhizopus delemar]
MPRLLSGQRKRSRVTYGILDFYTSGPMSIAASEELNEIKAEQKKNQELINTLKKENILLNSQLKAIKGCHNAETLSKNARIEDLIVKNAEAEARAVYHMKANKETTEALEEAKSEHIRKANKWESRERVLLSEIEAVREDSYGKIDEYGRLMIQKEEVEKETAEKEKEIEINHLNAMIDLMSRANLESKLNQI